MQRLMRIVFRLCLISSPCVLALALALFPPLGVQAANIVVSTGSAYPCNETGLKNAIQDAGTGKVSFNCVDTNIITLTSPALISGVALVVDGANGGGAMMLSGGTTASIFTAASLEPVLHAKLQDALIAGRRQDPAKRPRREVGDRVAPVEIVQKVERLDTGLEIPRRAE